MRSFVWNGRPQYYTDEPSWQTRPPHCSRADWHARAGTGGHAGGLEVLWSPEQSCRHRHLLGHDRPAVLSTSAAPASEKLHKTSGCNPGLETGWQMTLPTPAACGAGTAVDADMLYITVTIQLPSSGSIMKSHPGALTLQFLLFKFTFSSHC